MRLSSLVASPASTAAEPLLAAGLLAADYYDGYPPPGLLVNTDGGRSFALRRGLTNSNVASLGIDGRGRVCAATNGNGYQCLDLESTSESRG